MLWKGSQMAQNLKSQGQAKLATLIAAEAKLSRTAPIGMWNGVVSYIALESVFILFIHEFAQLF